MSICMLGHVPDVRNTVVNKTCKNSCSQGIEILAEWRQIINKITKSNSYYPR